MEIYSTIDGNGRRFSVHKEQLAPGVAAYFINVSTPTGVQRCTLSANSALHLGRALLCSVHDDDALEPAPEIPPPPIPPTRHAAD